MMRSRQQQSGSAMALAVIILFILAAIILVISTSTLSSMFETKRKTERTTGMAAADSAIESIRVALNDHLMDESDGFSLTQADLTKLVGAAGGEVIPNSQTSDRWGMTKVLVSPAEAYTVREKADAGYSYWQIVLVHEPRYHSGKSSDLVVYIRAWATQSGTINEGGTNITTQPRVFRVEFRPGYFSDYQSISDGPFFSQITNGTWQISGPVHTNGFAGDEWITQGKSGYDLKGPVKCSGRARLTASQSVSMASLGGCAKFAGSNTARQISLLNVDKTLQYMRSRCDNQGMGTGGLSDMPQSGIPVHCFFNGQKSYDVRLANDGVHVGNTVVPLVPNPRCGMSGSTDCGDELMAAVLVDGDVNLSGTVSGGAKAARVTIATMRQDPNDQPARIWIEPKSGLIQNIFGQLTGGGSNDGIVGADNPNVDTVGLISQGDIIMGIRPNECASAMNVAGIAQSGSFTMPRELVTVSAPNVPNMDAYDCKGGMTLTGSVAMHGGLISNMSWNQIVYGIQKAGYEQFRFDYQKSLFDNPPPFYSLAYPWAMTKLKDADRRCLEGSGAKDPRCE